MPSTVFALKITSLEWYWGEYHLKNRHDLSKHGALLKEFSSKLLLEPLEYALEARQHLPL